MPPFRSGHHVDFVNIGYRFILVRRKRSALFYESNLTLAPVSEPRLVAPHRPGVLTTLLGCYFCVKIGNGFGGGSRSGFWVPSFILQGLSL